ncbi:hypothetical protein ACIOZM_05265, partial [Pseudomonas sp. NPDC087346]|uniref:hypothetical protein n=1 Tax=Pseudomonas sp. NPDC087346 TaxID=3364438 RepID=UPI003816CD3D
MVSLVVVMLAPFLKATANLCRSCGTLRSFFIKKKNKKIAAGTRDQGGSGGIEKSPRILNIRGIF